MNTLIQYFYEKEKSEADKPFLHQPFGDQWETYTWSEVGQQARKLATWLQQNCNKEKAHISIVSKNCREWVISDIAIQMAGYISVPFYANLSGKQLAEVIGLGDIDLILIGKVDGWEDMKKGIPSDLKVGKFPHYEGTPIIDLGTSWDEIMSSHPLKESPIPDTNDTWSIIFTSGTTGTPKGAFFTHDTVSKVVVSPHMAEWLKVTPETNNKFFSYLPLNHIAERHLLVAAIGIGAEIYFTESLDTFGKNLRDAKPTCFFAVPRIWTKFKQGILAMMPQEQLAEALANDEQRAAVQQKLKLALGLENALVCITGAAPMTKHDVEWWLAAGFPLSDGYGQTENFAIATYSPVGKLKPGSVGIAQKGVELKVDTDTNEIMTKSEKVMEGYYKDEEKTDETIVDGWLHTGDAGKIDEDGYLFITGRVKDTFKTEKGQFIVPAKIENLYGPNNDIEQMCLLGLGMPHPIMMIVPSEAAASKTKEALEVSLQGTMDAVNANLLNYTKVKTLVVVKDAFSAENGLLTPTLKVKRFNVHEKYAPTLRMYCEDDRCVIWEE